MTNPLIATQRSAPLWHVIACSALVLALAGCAGPTGMVRASSDGKADEIGLQVAAPGSDATNTSGGISAQLIGAVGHQGTRQFLQVMSSTFASDARLQATSIRASAFDVRAAALENPIRPDISANARTYWGGVSVTASQPLYDFGKRKARIAQIRADGLSETHDLARQREALLREGLGAVLDVWYASEKISVRKRQISDLGEAVQSAARLESMGLITAADMRFAEVEMQRAQVELQEAETEAAEAKRVWENVAGSAPIPGSVDFMALRKAAGIQSFEQAQTVSASRNLGLRSLDAGKAQLAAEAAVLERQNTPTINATVEGRANGSHRGVNGGLTVSLPIYQRDAKDDLAQLRARQKAADAERGSEQSDLQFQLRQQSERITSLQSLATKQRESLRLLNLRVGDLSRQLETGLASYDDFLTAQIDANETELAILANIDEVRRAQAKIVLLTGVLIP